MRQISKALTHCRERFPALTRPGAPVFLDNPGGTQAPREVIEAMTEYLSYGSSNVGGAFAVSERTDAVIKEAHEAMADFVGAQHPEEVSFGANMTSLTFSLSRALARELREGDEIVLTNLDHDANVAPWLLLARDLGLEVRWADINPEDCTLDIQSFQDALSERTRIAAFTYASNAVGAVNDVRRLTRMAHDAGALVYIDAVQYAPHGLMDAREIDCDFLVCSPYKFFGPHAGVLYSRLDHSERLEAYKVRPAKDAPPHKWETGTGNFEAMAGTAAAVEYLASLAPENSGTSRRERLEAAMLEISSYEEGLSRQLIEGLQQLPVQIHGIQDMDRLYQRVPTFAITAESQSPRELATAMGKRGYNLWNGNYYALVLMERLGLEDSGGALRIGMAHYNTPDEVSSFVTDLGEVLRS